MQCKYRVVLSIDGGGIRGVIPLRIIQFLEQIIQREEPKINLSNWIDVVSATSTSSIITSALLLKDTRGKLAYSTEQLLNLYLLHGHRLFKPVELNPNRTRYPLEFLLNTFFQNYTLQDLGKHYLYVSYDLNHESPFYFSSEKPHYQNLSLGKVMTACSAFPGIFPPLAIENKLLADGTIVAKNPSKIAYQYARMFYPEDPIVVISLGTGHTEKGQLHVLDQEAQQTHEEMRTLSKTDDQLIYFRFQPELEESSPNMQYTNSENAESLIEETDRYLLTQAHEFDRIMSLIRIKIGQVA